MNFTKGQQEVLKNLKNKKNLDIEGIFGSGKTYIIKHGLKYIKNVVFLAPSGVSATNVNGQTFNSFFSIKPGGVFLKQDAIYVKKSKRLLWEKTKTIVVDEKSMLRPDVLDAAFYNMFKNGVDPFKKKWIFVGDMKQLPTIIKPNEKEVFNKFYEDETYQSSQYYKELKCLKIELNEVKRQDDVEFINALINVRNGVKEPYFKQFYNLNKGGITLCLTNKRVKEINDTYLDKIDGQLYHNKAIVSGEVNQNDLLVDFELSFKNGCEIMYLVNDDFGYNGLIGELLIENKQLYFLKEKLKFPINLYRWEIIEYAIEGDELSKHIKGYVIQYPFKVCAAMTIHKSQSLTLDKITVDLSDRNRNEQLSPALLSVALSRCKTPEGLTIKTK